MRQVPPFSQYGLIGDGKLAKHFAHYLSLLGLSYVQWARSQGSSLCEKKFSSCSHILILISDRSIESFIQDHVFLKGFFLVHCSGSLASKYAVGAHPLFSFSHGLCSLEEYRSIPFVIDQGHSFEEVLPNIPNPSYSIEKENKALYHALCAMGGNFPQILWGKYTRELKNLGLPKEVCFPYLRSIVQNFLQYGEKALTGPLSRGDQKTVEKHLLSLEGDPWKQVYQAFVKVFEEDRL